MLYADRAEIERFFSLMFRYADEHTWVSLRAFDQFDRKATAFRIEAVRISADSEPIIRKAKILSDEAANYESPIVFAPPVATFTSSRSASHADLANGLGLSVEVDKSSPVKARRTLEHILGPVTVAVHSGGFWHDENTGEIEAKEHQHWRLSEPTRTPADHAKLREARHLAAILVGADTSAAPPSHPLRWPGSWNRKTDTPRLAKIAVGNEAAEIHLDDALEKLQLAVEAAGLQLITPQQSSDPQAPVPLVADAMRVLPNNDVDWEEWNRIGMAVWRATGASEEGLDIWTEWSAKSRKHDEKTCVIRWQHYAKSPPQRIGAGTIFFLAGRCGWERPRTPDPEPPNDMPDEWWQSIFADAGPSCAPPPGTEEHRHSASEPTAFYDPWSDPVPPDFPDGVLAPEIEETAVTMARRDGLCPGIQCMAFIAAVSGAAPKNARFYPYKDGDWWVPPIVWVVPIAPSGQRKTAAADNAFEPLNEIHSQTWREYKNKLIAYKALPAKERKTTPEPEEPHSFIVDDISVEKLQIILAATNRGTAMVRDEIVGLLGFGRYSKEAAASERAYYLRAYEARSYSVHRVGRESIHIDVNGVSIFGSIQPDRIAEFEGLDRDGFIQRTNPILGSKTPVSRPDVAVSELGKKLFADIIRFLTRMEGRTYQTTDEGAALIHQTEEDGKEFATITDFGEGFQGWCSKMHGTHARFALILHMMENPQEPIVPTETVARAGRLVREFLLPQARDFFAAVIGSTVARQRDIGGWLLTKAPVRFAARDLMGGVWMCRKLSTKQINDVLDPFIAGGWITPETAFPNNRAWSLNDGVREAFAARAAEEKERRETLRKILLKTDGKRNKE